MSLREYLPQSKYLDLNVSLLTHITVAAEWPVKDTIRGWFPLIVVGLEESWSVPVSCLNAALIKQPQNLHICTKKTMSSLVGILCDHQHCIFSL